MNTAVVKIKESLPDITVIYLLPKNGKLSQISLTKTEEAYIKQQLSSNKSVTLNTYYRWVFIRVPERLECLSETLEKARRESCCIYEKLKEQKITEIQIINETDLPELSLAYAEGLLLSQYHFSKYISEKKRTEHELKKIYFTQSTLQEKRLSELHHLIEGVYITRDLINEPANVLNSINFAKEVRKIAKEAGLQITVFEKKEIEAMKMGGLLAVNRGSVDPPCFIKLEHKPKNAKNKKPIIYVGKGITFDSGGLNIKPGDSMDTMKCDMSGAAAVLGCMYALAKNEVPVHFIGLIPLTDNRPGFNAFAPGDIITMMDGSTVEMLNSDAEGRMILADALHYAKQFKPMVVIDIATLTGSASAAVGRNATVVFANTDETIYKKLENAAFSTWERVVRFPLWNDYAESLKSDIADIKNIGNKQAGAITAAKFLEHFTNYPWIHLDIAGPAFLTEKDSYRSNGATGIGVRMVYQFVKSLI